MRYNYLTEEQIKRCVKQMLDQLDLVYDAGDITEQDYYKTACQIVKWAHIKYAIAKDNRVFKSWMKDNER